MNRADRRRQGASGKTGDQSVRAWLDQGRAHQQAGRLTEAEDAYRHALELAPHDAESCHLLGLVSYRLNRLAESLRYLHAAVERQPSLPVYWFNLGVVSQKAGRSPDAVSAYEKAIALRPQESVYHHNFAVTVYLFRRDATNYFQIPEQQVFDKAMVLYNRALELDPDNFPLATDLAQTYYGIRPPRVQDAFEAWNRALKLARDDIEREGVYLHLARWHRTAGDVEAARRELNRVTNGMYNVTKTNILKSLASPKRTNSAPAAVSPLP